MLDMMTPEEALIEAIRKIGGPAAVGRAFDPPISRAAVSQWRVAPYKRCRRLSELAGGDPSIYQLRPDVFGEAPSGQSPASSDVERAAA